MCLEQNPWRAGSDHWRFRQRQDTGLVKMLGKDEVLTLHAFYIQFLIEKFRKDVNMG